MESATITRHSSVDFASSRFFSKAFPVALTFPAFVVNTEVIRRCDSSRSKSSDSFVSAPDLIRSWMPDTPKASMSKAERPAKYVIRASNWPGHPCVLGHLQSASSTLACTNGVPHSGQTVENTNGFSDPSRASATGPSTSGMTSPALRMVTLSPISTPLS